MLNKILVLILSVTFSLSAQEIIEITVKGISDARADGAQKDRNEAILDAKKQACEKAGLQLKSNTQVENFQVVFDYIESQAEAVLLPGFQIIDVGYVQDGTYQVVLSGKIKTVEDQEQISAKELRYAHNLYNRAEFSQARQILEKYMDSADPNIDEALKEESFYFFIKWGFSYNIKNDCEKFVSYYPHSNKTDNLLAFAAFSAEPLLKYSKDITEENTSWEEGPFTVEKQIYQRKKNVLHDEVSFTDFHNKQISIITEFTIFQKNDLEENEPSAYHLSIKSIVEGQTNIIAERVTTLKTNKNKTFQHSSSGKWFNNFSLKFFQVKGDLPLDQKTYSFNIAFDIYQKGF